MKRKAQEITRKANETSRENNIELDRDPLRNLLLQLAKYVVAGKKPAYTYLYLRPEKGFKEKTEELLNHVIRVNSSHIYEYPDKPNLFEIGVNAMGIIIQKIRYENGLGAQDAFNALIAKEREKIVAKKKNFADNDTDDDTSPLKPAQKKPRKSLVAELREKLKLMAGRVNELKDQLSESTTQLSLTNNTLSEQYTITAEFQLRAEAAELQNEELRTALEDSDLEPEHEEIESVLQQSKAVTAEGANNTANSRAAYLKILRKLRRDSRASGVARVEDAHKDNALVESVLNDSGSVLAKSRQTVQWAKELREIGQDGAMTARPTGLQPHPLGY